MKNGQNDKVLELAQKFKEEALVPMKEDISDWMSIILSPEKILAEKLLETLCTGVIACKLAQKLCSLIDGSIEKPKVNARATQGTFFARDNAANFLAWCRKLGVPDSLIFESDGMCSAEPLQQTPRQVLLCFLEIARIFGRRSDYKGALPDLVKFEQEIDNFSTGSNSSGRSSAPPESTFSTSPVKSASSSRLTAAVGPGLTEKATSHVTSPRSSGSKIPSSRKTPTKSGRPKTAPVKNTLLDESINKVAQAEPFNGKGPEIQRVSEGKYRIDGKLVFIRMLKDRHVMVRVGGGWDTLANYLLKHDCQKLVKLPTPTKSSLKLKNRDASPRKLIPLEEAVKRLEKKDGGFLFPVSPRYKSSSPANSPMNKENSQKSRKQSLK